MFDTEIYTSSAKALPANSDIEYSLTVLFSHPEGEWFAPTNMDCGKYSQAYTICDELCRYGLICKQSIPIWRSGAMRGGTIKFLYKKDMDYSNI